VQIAGVFLRATPAKRDKNVLTPRQLPRYLIGTDNALYREVNSGCRRTWARVDLSMSPGTVEPTGDSGWRVRASGPVALLNSRAP
jgi:hypothetical protein